MSITEANAMNEIAGEVIALAQVGVNISPSLEHGISIALINAYGRLHAGYSSKSFLDALDFAQRRTKIRRAKRGSA